MTIRSAPPVILLVLLSVCVGACGVRGSRFAVRDRPTTGNTVHPWRVGVVVDKQFTPFETKFRYWSTGNYTYRMDGLPDAFVKTLTPYFRSVEPLPMGRSNSTQHDLVARMIVDSIHFDGANTTISQDKVDLVMTFVLAQSDGTEVFHRTFTASATAYYKQPCAFCKPQPSEVFHKAFTSVFLDLGSALNQSVIQVVPR